MTRRSTPEQAWLGRVVQGVTAHLTTYLEARAAEAASISPRAPELIEALTGLTLRGGKRLRPAVLYAGYRAAGGGEALEPVLDAGASLELLQTYLLIQDDWMDGDEERRGGPSVHTALSRAYGDTHIGASLAMLAADLGAGFAFELIAEAPFPAARRRQALAAYGRMHFEVVAGQQLDVHHHADVALTHQLKTGSYTVRGPLTLGALLADASPEQLRALERFGAPVGIAFQLRDDVLGTFGDKSAVGKPVGADLRAGKRTALVDEARASLSPAQLTPLQAVLGVADASDGAVLEATELLERSGVRARVEARLEALRSEAASALDDASLAPAGRELLADLLDVLVRRAR